MQAGIELGIGPHGFEFRRANAVGVGSFLQVHRALDCRNPARPLVRLAVAGPSHIENLFEALTVLCPALDDLDSIEVTGGRIFYRPDNRGRSNTGSRAGHSRWVGTH